MTIPAEGTDDTNVALGDGAPCGKGGGLVAVTSAISCACVHTHTHKGKEGGTAQIIMTLPLSVKSLSIDWTTHAHLSEKPLTKGFLLAKQLAPTGSLDLSPAQSCCTAVGGRTWYS